MKKLVKNFISGIFVGIANAMPGVSGGTILVIMGLFEPLMNAINNILKKDNPNRFQDILFAASIVIGGVLGIVVFSSLFEPLLWYAFIPVMFFFMGLILVSSYFIYKKDLKELKNLSLVYILLGIVVVAVPSLIMNKETVTSVNIPNMDLLLLAQMLVIGFIGGFAMILPGISGSFVLLLLGYYYLIYFGYVLEVKAFNLSLNVLFPMGFFALGVMVGIYLGSKFCVIAFKHFKNESHNTILGMLIGSVIALIPFKASQMVNVKYDKLGNEIEKIYYHYDLKTIVFSLVAFIIGGLIIYLLESQANSKEKR